MSGIKPNVPQSATAPGTTESAHSSSEIRATVQRTPTRIIVTAIDPVAEQQKQAVIVRIHTRIAEIKVQREQLAKRYSALQTTNTNQRNTYQQALIAQTVSEDARLIEEAKRLRKELEGWRSKWRRDPRLQGYKVITTPSPADTVKLSDKKKISREPHPVRPTGCFTYWRPWEEVPCSGPPVAHTGDQQRQVDTKTQRRPLNLETGIKVKLSRLPGKKSWTVDAQPQTNK